MTAAVVTGETRSRRIQLRSAALDDALVRSSLRPARTFVPADMLISWIISEGHRYGGPERLEVYLWPAPGPGPSDNARWVFYGAATDRGTMPGWLSEAADDLLAVLTAGAPEPAGETERGISLSRRYRMDGAPRTGTGSGFVPEELIVSWQVDHAGVSPKYLLALRPDRAGDSRESISWSGTLAGGYDESVPSWAADAAAECLADLLSARPETLSEGPR